MRQFEKFKWYDVGCGCLVREIRAIKDQYVYSSRRRTLNLAPLLRNLGGKARKIG